MQALFIFNSIFFGHCHWILLFAFQLEQLFVRIFPVARSIVIIAPTEPAVDATKSTTRDLLSTKSFVDFTIRDLLEVCTHFFGHPQFFRLCGLT
jgi:hypothetical protein